MAIFSSDEYSWNHISVSINGIEVMALLGITYDHSIEAEHSYGKGSKPLSIQVGNEKIEGTLKLHKSELDKLLKPGNAGVKALKGLTITWAFTDAGRYSIRTLIGCQITKVGEAYNQGDKFATIELPFLALDINYI